MLSPSVRDLELPQPKRVFSSLGAEQNAAAILLGGGNQTVDGLLDHRRFVPLASRAEQQFHLLSDAALIIPVPFEEAAGTVLAARRSAVSSRIMARIERIEVRAGDYVKAGDLLIVLDDRDLQARVEQADQALESAQALLKNADAEYQRLKKLFETKVVSRSELDRAEANFGVARAQETRAKKLIEEARVALTYSEIAAPAAGRVIDRLAEPGDTAAPGAPLLRPARLVEVRCWPVASCCSVVLASMSYRFLSANSAGSVDQTVKCFVHHGQCACAGLVGALVSQQRRKFFVHVDTRRARAFGSKTRSSVSIDRCATAGITCRRSQPAQCCPCQIVDGAGCVDWLIPQASNSKGDGSVRGLTGRRRGDIASAERCAHGERGRARSYEEWLSGVACKIDSRAVDRVYFVSDVCGQRIEFCAKARKA